MRSFFSKFQSFPEWNYMNKTIDATVQSQQKGNSEANAALGKNFSEFAKKQPNESISDVIIHLEDELKKLQEKKASDSQNLVTIKADLSRLKILNDEIKSKRKNREQIKYRADKSTKAAEKAESRLNQYKNKNLDSPDAIKAQDDYDLASRQKQSDITALDERDALLMTEEKDYKKELFKVILSSLSQYVSSKSQIASSLVPLGTNITNLGSQIPPYTDESIETLQTELQAVRSEPIE